MQQIEPSSIRAIIALEQIDTRTYRSPVIASYLARTFGGQLVAQAVAAALQSADPDYGLHSVHSYFVAPGNPTQPTVFRVHIVGKGRSFHHMHVTGEQEGHTIFTVQCSFHRRGDKGIEHAAHMPQVVMPHDIEVDYSQLSRSERALLHEWSLWDIRKVPEEKRHADPHSPHTQQVWFRSRETLGNNEFVQTCALTYMSDMTLLHAAAGVDPHHKVQMASLDHTIWFMRPMRADQWLLYDQVVTSGHSGRSLVQGKIFQEDGELVAVVMQEGLTRTLNPGSATLPMA